jgi:uncharacterized protein involved in exopolysaccharide biosynthesis
MSDDGLDGGGLPDFLRDPKGLLRRRWRWMAVVLVLGLAATATYVSSIPIRYLATATILVSSQQIPKTMIESTVIETPFQRINALVGELTSRERLLDLERKHDLFPALRDRVSSTELVQLVQGSIELDTQQGIGPRRRGDTSSIYSISFYHARPQVAAAVANELAGDFTAASVRMRGQQARLTTEFMRSQMEDKERELRAQDAQITAFKERYRGELPSELGANLAKLERLAAEQQSVTGAIAEAETRLAMMTSSEAPEVANSPLGRLTALRSKLAEESALHTDEHPNVVSLRRQIVTLQAEIEGGGIDAGDPTRQILIGSSERSIRELRTRLATIRADIRDREARVARTPKREEELGALEDRGSVLRDEYLALLRKVETAELAEKLESAQQGERVSVLDRALPPVLPERTRVRYMLAGLVGSLGLAMLLGLVMEFFDPVLFSAEQIEESFELPVLGSVPRIS